MTGENNMEIKSNRKKKQEKEPDNIRIIIKKFLFQYKYYYPKFY